MDTSRVTIEVKDLSKRFGQVTALDKVSFSVHAGELFFILGPSGCGKTTLLRILAGLETPDSGAILLNGRDMASLAPHQRGTPMVFQNYALWPHLTVSDNIAFGLVEQKTPRKEIQARVTDVLRRVGMDGLGDRMPAQLSGGQQQRVVLARALVLNPTVILLDEPLSNLDAKLRNEMRDEIEALHRETDITFIYVTHDQVEALSLSDRMAILNAGRLSALGAPLDLYHRPPNLFCAEFIGEANIVPGRIMDQTGETFHVATAVGDWLAVRAGADSLKIGDAIRCLVRPESIRPAGPAPGSAAAGPASGPPPAGVNRFEAQVKSVRLNGSTLSVVLQAGGINLKAVLLNTYPQRLNPGASVAWEVETGHTVIIPST